MRSDQPLLHLHRITETFLANFQPREQRARLPGTFIKFKPELLFNGVFFRVAPCRLQLRRLNRDRSVVKISAYDPFRIAPSGICNYTLFKGLVRFNAGLNFNI